MAIRRSKALAAALLALAVALEAGAQQPRSEPQEPDTAEEDASALARQESREARRLRTEQLRLAARTVRWQAPDELRELYEQFVPGPEVSEGEVKAGTLRSFLREVARRVPEIAAAEGYFDAKYEARVEGAGETGVLVIEVTPGPRTKIDKVVIEFEGDVAGEGEDRAAIREAVTAAWTLPEGRFFRQADWDDAKSRLIERLAERHYAAAQIADSAALVDVPSSTATAKVILESGPRFTFGPMAFTGLKRYPEALVRRYNRMVPGEPYALDKVLEFQRTLQNAPWFASVVVDVERDPSHPRDVPVKVSLVERTPVDVGFSLGYGTDSGARGEVSLRHRNAFGNALDMHSALAIDQTRQIGYADFYLPALSLGGPFGDRLDTRDSVGFLGERKENQGLETQRVALASYRAFKIGGADYRAGLTYQFERKMPDGADESIARALAPVAEATWRWVDDVLDPKRGGVLKVRAAAGAAALLSTQDFLQAYALYQHWFPLSPNDQLIVRAELGRTFASSRVGIPEDFLFRAGGTRSVRGYEFESLGVRDGDAIVGGRFLATGSVEYVRWFSKSWGGALFYDVGDAADSRDTLGKNAGYGAGVRWRTPAGPLAFDLAYADRDSKVRLSFSVSIAF